MMSATSVPSLELVMLEQELGVFASQLNTG